MTNADMLLERIKSLPPERVAEVEDFVAFLAERERARLACPCRDETARARFRRNLEKSGRLRLRLPFEFGDVLLVPFPFTDRSASQQRAAVGVGRGVCDQAKPEVVLVAVASLLRPGAAFG